MICLPRKLHRTDVQFTSAALPLQDAREGLLHCRCPGWNLRSICVITAAMASPIPGRKPSLQDALSYEIVLKK